MDDFDAALAVVTGLPDQVDATMRRLRDLLPADLHVQGPAPRSFTIDDDGRDAGTAVELYGRRTDQRAVAWIVEAWLHPAGPGDWTVTVKAEIDLDDDEGDDRCVLNEQQVVQELADLPAAIATAAGLVENHPRTDLLTPGWQPAEWDDGSPPGQE